MGRLVPLLANRSLDPLRRIPNENTITTLTVSAGTGRSTVGATAPFGLVYRAAAATWFRI